MMKALITNDDGPNSQGLYLATKILGDIIPFEIVIPKEKMNAKSMAYSAFENKKVTKTSVFNYDAYLVDGMPADSTIIGLKLFDPDFVFSGINLGENLATDIYYSGTVGNAITAMINGKKSISVSLELKDYADSLVGIEKVKDEDFSYVVSFLKKFIKKILDNGYPKDVGMFNINFPKKISKNTKVKLTKLGIRSYDFDEIKREEKKYGYDIRIIGYPMDILEKGFDNYVVKNEKAISITPLNFDRILTDKISDESKRKLNQIISNL